MPRLERDTDFVSQKIFAILTKNGVYDIITEIDIIYEFEVLRRMVN